MPKLHIVSANRETLYGIGDQKDDRNTLKDPRKRPKLHTEALQAWVGNPRYILKIHIEPLGKGINTLIET